MCFKNDMNSKLLTVSDLTAGTRMDRRPYQWCRFRLDWWSQRRAAGTCCPCTGTPPTETTWTRTWPRPCPWAAWPWSSDAAGPRATTSTPLWRRIPAARVPSECPWWVFLMFDFVQRDPFIFGFTEEPRRVKRFHKRIIDSSEGERLCNIRRSPRRTDNIEMLTRMHLNMDNTCKIRSLYVWYTHDTLASCLSDLLFWKKKAKKKNKTKQKTLPLKSTIDASEMQNFTGL